MFFLNGGTQKSVSDEGVKLKKNDCIAGSLKNTGTFDATLQPIC